MTARSWTSHPARERPLAAAVTICLIAAAGILAGFAAESLAVSLLAPALLVLSLRRFFFATTQVVDEQGVAVRCVGFETRHPWSRLRRFRHDEQGAFLSTRVRPSVLDSFTGLHLTWAGNAADVVPVIERRMATGEAGTAAGADSAA